MRCHRHAERRHKNRHANSESQQFKSNMWCYGSIIHQQRFVYRRRLRQPFQSGAGDVYYLPYSYRIRQLVDHFKMYLPGVRTACPICTSLKLTRILNAAGWPYGHHCKSACLSLEGTSSGIEPRSGQFVKKVTILLLPFFSSSSCGQSAFLFLSFVFALLVPRLKKIDYRWLNVIKEIRF